MGEDIYNEVVKHVEAGLNTAYSSQAPWQICHDEYTGNGRYRARDWLQITRDTTKRQPCHWDTSTPWFKNKRGHWAPLSIVLHINDGLSTFLPGPPADMFGKMRYTAQNFTNFTFFRYTAENCFPHKVLASSLLNTLKDYDKVDMKVDPAQRQRSRAGQCLAFHSGEQAHAGMGWDGLEDPVTPTWSGRVISYFFAVPASEYDFVLKGSLFNPELPWGLMMNGLTEKMVFLS